MGVISFTGQASSRQRPIDCRFDLGDPEGLSGDFIARLGVDQILVAQYRLQLASIHLWHENALVAAQQRSQVPRQRPQVAQVNVADICATSARARYRLMDRAIGRAPADDGEVAAGLTEGHPLLRDEIGDAVDLGLARLGHLLVIVWLVADVARLEAFLDAADAVREARRSRLDP